MNPSIDKYTLFSVLQKVEEALLHYLLLQSEVDNLVSFDFNRHE